MKNVRIEGKSEIQELEILGDWAWMRNRLELTITPPKGKRGCIPVRRSRSFARILTAIGSLPAMQIF